MKKKIILISALAAVGLLIAAGFILYPYVVPRSMEQTLHVDFSKVDGVIIVSGSNMNHDYIEGGQNVKEFLNIFQGAKLRKSFDQSNDRTGIIYAATLYEGENAVLWFDFGFNEITVYGQDGRMTARYISTKNIGSAQLRQIGEKYGLRKPSQ